MVDKLLDRRLHLSAVTAMRNVHGMSAARSRAEQGYDKRSWSVSMCDYSLRSVQSRPAKAGDMLITSEFRHSFSRGFTAVGEPDVAVCVLPGTELAFSDDAVCDHPFARLFPRMFGGIGARLARFRKIDQEITDTHHDALEFANGKVVLLTRLRPGQVATVLQLPAMDHADRKIVEEEHGPRSAVQNHGRVAGS
ncbi:hypothetical protein [Bradyrhizobium sp. LHD-71]|uniref:hypothetical protein n=1 Tax=Bradyrhizobium sp. LHD-71 TaxID=3072141 RepID=UPI00280E9902|nr:hypothetical protein [Bradyrhizobium sp. LHD-71]MDQ8732147.1 hypothetical protein [Bradyrhizobium sp. LHD-71]